MLRVYRLIAAIAVLHTAFCDSASADSDNSVVSVSIDKDTSYVSVSGRTRVDVVAAVLRGLEDCQLPADGVTVGPWLRLPENGQRETDKRPRLTVCIGDGFERGATTAYIGVTPKVSFKIVIAIATELRACGVIDVRLLSGETIRSEILTLTRQQVRDASTVNRTHGKDSE